MSDKGGLSAGGIFNFLIATDNAAGQAKLNKDLQKKQMAENRRAAGESTLARWSQSLSNSKLFERAGKGYNAITENLSRMQDTQTLSRVQRELVLSERLGAATAAFAAMGVGGSSTETYNRTIQTTAAIEDEQQERNFRSSTYLTDQQRGSIMTDAVDGMSRDIIRANLDFTNYGPTKGPSLLGNIATLAVAAGASAAGAPQVGDMIIKARTAGLQNSYGDGKGASKSFGSALDDMKEAVSQVKDVFKFSDTPSLRPVDISNWSAGPINIGSSTLMR